MYSELYSVKWWCLMFHAPSAIASFYFTIYCHRSLVRSSMFLFSSTPQLKFTGFPPTLLNSTQSTSFLPHFVATKPIFISIPSNSILTAHDVMVLPTTSMIWYFFCAVACFWFLPRQNRYPCHSVACIHAIQIQLCYIRFWKGTQRNYKLFNLMIIIIIILFSEKFLKTIKFTKGTFNGFVRIF